MPIKKLFVSVLSAAVLVGCAAKNQAGSGTGATGAAPASNTRIVKSVDGSFDGEIVGTPAPSGKFAKLRIGMAKRQVEDLIGPSNDEDGYMTGKAFIPFFFGGDTHRLVEFYKNEGQLTYSPEHMGGSPNVLIRIEVNPAETGYRH
jgi:hypothetical protein